MPRTASIYSTPSQCPCCPYGVSSEGSVRTDHLRRHVARMHSKIRNYDYVDDGGNTVKKLTETRLIQLDKTGSPANGFCFECGSWVCLMDFFKKNREARMLEHICREKQERPKRKNGTAVAKPQKEIIEMEEPEETLKGFFADMKTYHPILFKPEKLKIIDEDLTEESTEFEILNSMFIHLKGLVNPSKACNQSDIIRQLQKELSEIKCQHDEEIDQKDIRHRTTIAEMEVQRDAMAREITRLNALLYSK